MAHEEIYEKLGRLLTELQEDDQAEKLTDWERDFVDDMAEKIGKGRAFTLKESEKIVEIAKKCGAE